MTRAPDADWTRDAFLGGRLEIEQPRKGYRAGIDAVLLAAAVPANPGDTVLEAGAGVGTPSLCLAARVDGVRVTGVEVDEDLCAAAGRNAEANALAARVGFVCADLLGPFASSQAAGIARESFDHVIANPPFFDSGESRGSPDPVRGRARTAAPGDLDGWFKYMLTVLRPSGRLTLIHRAEAIGRLLRACENRFGDLQILPVHPLADRPANLVLLHAVKASRAPARWWRGIALHDAAGGYVPEIESVLREGRALGVFRAPGA